MQNQMQIKIKNLEQIIKKNSINLDQNQSNKLKGNKQKLHTKQKFGQSFQNFISNLETQFIKNQQDYLQNEIIQMFSFTKKNQEKDLNQKDLLQDKRQSKQIKGLLKYSEQIEDSQEDQELFDEWDIKDNKSEKKVIQQENVKVGKYVKKLIREQDKMYRILNISNEKQVQNDLSISKKVKKLYQQQQIISKKLEEQNMSLNINQEKVNTKKNKNQQQHKKKQSTKYEQNVKSIQISRKSNFLTPKNKKQQLNLQKSLSITAGSQLQINESKEKEQSKFSFQKYSEDIEDETSQDTLYEGEVDKSNDEDILEETINVQSNQQSSNKSLTENQSFQKNESQQNVNMQ